MAESIRGFLPIRPHLLRYVEWREGLAPGAPVQLPGPSLVGVTLNLILVSKSRLLLSPDGRATALAHCTARLHYEVHGRRYWHNQIFVTDDAALAFGEFLASLMHHDLLEQIIAGQRDRRLEKDVIVQFMIATGIDDFIEFEAMKQAQFRFRRKIGYRHHRGNQPAGYTLSRQPVQYARAHRRSIPRTLFDQE